MKKRIIVFLCILAALFSSVSVNADEHAAEQIGKIIEYEMIQANASDTKEYLEVGLMPYAGNGAEWLAVYLHEAGYEANYEAYNEALDDFLKNNASLTLTDYERIAIAKSCFGADVQWIKEIIGKCGDESGLMEIIYGIILANSGDYADRNTVMGLSDILISKQMENGGWSLGGPADPDITAEALLALAPYYDEYKNEADRALELLSSMQRESGAFASYGNENTESSAQVIIALCALGIDCRTDVRFIKNGHSIIDGMEQFRLNDGSFMHVAGTMSNKMATTQALSAYIAVEKMDSQNGALYEFKNEPGVAEHEIAEHEIAENVTPKTMTGKTIRIIIWAVCAAVFSVYIIVMGIRRKLKSVTTLIVTVLLAGISIFAVFAKIQSREEYYSGIDTSGEIATNVSIAGPEGEIFAEGRVLVNEGDTAFDQLVKILKQNRINLDYSKNPITGDIYVRGIGGISEFAYGSKSGWTYRINGEYPGVACNAYRIKENDLIEWIYVTGEVDNEEI
ncbi:MAG: DUF4430 domain-containing protein [Butyrivibrio sp.]|nr:DUF4430 domain-containing protein [Butyrivibrio sp.]